MGEDLIDAIRTVGGVILGVSLVGLVVASVYAWADVSGPFAAPIRLVESIGVGVFIVPLGLLIYAMYSLWSDQY